MCILIPLLVGLISALLGYLLGKLGSKTNTIVDTSEALRLELENCRKKSAALNGEISELKLALSKTSITSQNFVADTASNSFAFDADAALAAFDKIIIANDLKIVEGIGPVIEELFHSAGIATWKQLAETSIAKCQEILDNAGDKFTMHNPATWPAQSKLAYEGKWVELKKWQDELKGGI